MVAANIHWGNRAYERILISANKNSTKMKLGSNNIYKPHNYWWRAVVVPTQNTTTANTTFMRNLFLKKSRVLTDLMGTHPHSHSFTVVIVIASIFLFLTMTITAAVIVFCRKRNTVFALQKSEQEPEYDFELDELTDIEYTETEFVNDVETCSIMRNKYARSLQHEESECCPAKQPLVSHKAAETIEMQYTPQYLSPHYAPKYSHLDEHAAYQKIVMATVLDKQGMTKSLLSTASDSDDSLYEKRLYKMCKSQHNYYGIAGLVNADVDSDSDSGLIKKTIRNFQGRLVCGGDNMNYDSLTSIESGQDTVITVHTHDDQTGSSRLLPQSPQRRVKNTSRQARYHHVNNGMEMRTFNCPKTSADLNHTDTDLLIKCDRKSKYSDASNNGQCSYQCMKKSKRPNSRMNRLHRTKSDSHIIALSHYDDDMYDDEMADYGV